MSVTHLGRIYEGLLEFAFEIAEEDGVYLEYQVGNEPRIEGYFDLYDLAELQKKRGYREIHRQNYRRHGFLLKNNENTRKLTASYYTPSSLSRFLVEKAVDRFIQQIDATGAAGQDGRTLQDVKILDTACGSGHFLVEALNYLTQCCLGRIDRDDALQALINDERVRIEAQTARLGLQAYEPTDAQILKRALLKRCIYGVDLNPFAVN